ncbi:MAG TPA: M48 family peptidase [Blastocatellia bacterium]|nr:M48 family peptidase [Blastocatellia bacterium]
MIEYEQLHLYSRITSDENLEALFDEALRALVKKQPIPKVEARFYPYAGLSSTIRLRQGRVFARVSDILKGSPREVLFALACILVAKLYRLKASKVHERVYKEYTLNPPIVDASHAARRRRGYKLTSSSRGKAYDLAELFSDLNTRYFAGSLDRPFLSWSRRPTRRVLGHHDHVHRAIIISSTLDKAAVPRFVVEYVLYHEMLHVKHPARIVSGRTVYHGRAFRDEERLFERFDEALKWLEKVTVPTAGKTRGRKRRPCN